MAKPTQERTDTVTSVAEVIALLQLLSKDMKIDPSLIEVRVLGSREVAYRVHPRGGGDYTGGVASLD